MKISQFFVLSILIIGLFASCLGTPIVFNDSLTDDQIAIVRFGNVNIVEYNGIAVKWEAGPYTRRDIRIPGGNTTFVLNGTVGTANMGYTKYNKVPFTFNFENGKEYTILINQNMINVNSGLQGSFPPLDSYLATFLMTSKGQILTHVNGKKVPD